MPGPRTPLIADGWRRAQRSRKRRSSPPATGVARIGGQAGHVQVFRHALLVAFQVGAHEVRAEFGVELGREHVRADAEHLVRILVGPGQHGRARRRLQHGLRMQHLGREAGGQAVQQLVAAGGSSSTVWVPSSPVVVADLAAQRMGQQLVAVTDAEHGQSGGGGLAQPGGGVLAPGLAVGDHGGRAGDQGGPIVLRCAGRAPCTGTTSTSPASRPAATAICSA